MGLRLIFFLVESEDEGRLGSVLYGKRESEFWGGDSAESARGVLECGQREWSEVSLSWESNKLRSFCFVKMMVMPPRKVVTCVFVVVRGENVATNDRFGAIQPKPD